MCTDQVFGGRDRPERTILAVTQPSGTVGGWREFVRSAALAMGKSRT